MSKQDVRPVRTVIFDFGRVIAHFDHRLALNRLRPYCRKPVEELYAAIYDGELEDAFEAGRLSAAEFLARLRQIDTFDCPDDVLSGHFVDIFWPNKPVCELIPRLKPRYRLLLGSNTNELHSGHFRKQFADTLRHFDALVLSHEVGARKPSAVFFDACLRFAGCAASECVFVDDLSANVAGAEACGLRGIVYTNDDDLRRRLAALGVVRDR